VAGGDACTARHRHQNAMGVMMGLKQFLTFSRLRRGRITDDEEDEENGKKKKKKSLRDIKYVRHGQQRVKKQIMDEIGDI